MKIANEINRVVTERTEFVEVSPAQIEQFKRYKPFPFSGSSESDFVGYLTKLLRFLHSNPDQTEKNGVPPIAFELLKKLCTDVRRQSAPCAVTAREDWMSARLVACDDNGTALEDGKVDAFVVVPNKAPEVFSLKESADGKNYEVYYSLSDEFVATHEYIESYYDGAIKQLKHDYKGESFEKGFWSATQTKMFNDFTNLDLGGSNTVLYVTIEKLGGKDAVIHQFLYGLGGASDQHVYVPFPKPDAKLVARQENNDSPIVLDNYRARLTTREIKKIRDFDDYFGNLKDKRISVGTFRDIGWGGFTSEAFELKKQEEAKVAAKKAAAEAAINKAKTTVPLKEEEFIKAYFPKEDAGLFKSGFIGAGLESYKEWLDEQDGDDLKKATKYGLELRAFRRIAREAINTITGNIPMRDKVLRLIDEHLKDDDKLVGTTLTELCSEIADTRDWMVHVETTKAKDYIKWKNDNDWPINSIPLPIVQAALEEFHDWAANAKRSDLVLVDDENVQDSMVLTNIALRVFAYVPNGKKQEAMIAQLNAQPFFFPKVEGNCMRELMKEAKGLKKKDAAKKKEPKHKYQLDWSYENVAKDRKNHSASTYKTLGEAKRSLFNSYKELRDEINEGGGYFDDYENEIWISDDGMRFGSRGLVEADYDITER